MRDPNGGTTPIGWRHSAVRAFAGGAPRPHLGRMNPETWFAVNAWIVATIVGVLLLVPTWRVFRRAGFSPAWSLLVLLGFPLGVLLVLAVLAFRPWPADPFPREARR